MENHTFTATLEVEPIAYLRSPFKEKFGIPRQPGLITACDSEIVMLSAFAHPDFFRELEHFTDLWLIFGFHQSLQKWKPLVRPPRLGGNKKVGVFSTRSPFRPNGLGLSKVSLKEVRFSANETILIISCPDMVDGTPIYDIKPYIHYADSNSQAKCGFAPNQPNQNLNVLFSDAALSSIQELSSKKYGNLKLLIEQILAQDPRPAYKDGERNNLYGMSLYDLNIEWNQSEQTALVEKISLKIDS